jgi:hypothetical protein
MDGSGRPAHSTECTGDQSQQQKQRSQQHQSNPHLCCVTSITALVWVIIRIMTRPNVLQCWSEACASLSCAHDTGSMRPRSTVAHVHKGLDAHECWIALIDARTLEATYLQLIMQHARAPLVRHAPSRPSRRNRRLRMTVIESGQQPTSVSCPSCRCSRAVGSALARWPSATLCASRTSLSMRTTGTSL